MSNNFCAKYRIYYEDTDAGGVVYYANYLKFYERARTEFLREMGISQFELEQKENLVFVVRRCEVDYITPARFDDLVEVSVKVKEINGASIVMQQEIKIGDKVLSRLDVTIVCITADSFRPKKIPQNIKTLLDAR